jgi:TonB family protein
MTGSTTDVIIARSRDVDRLSTMVLWSVAAHVVVTAVVLLVPHPQADLKPKEVMVISLGGAPGPRTGMTQMSARNVQAVQPDVKKPEAAPTPVPQDMTLPNPKAKPQPQPKPKTAPKEAAAKTASTGAEVQKGAAKAETRVRGQGFAGLSTGGGGGVGGITVDAPDFCCPGYITTMAELVKQNWNGNHGLVGVTTMMFTVTRDGRIEAVKLEKSSGFTVLDTEAGRALRVTRLPPLPSRYTNPTLTVHLEFAYER